MESATTAQRVRVPPKWLEQWLVSELVKDLRLPWDEQLGSQGFGPEELKGLGLGSEKSASQTPPQSRSLSMTSTNGAQQSCPQSPAAAATRVKAAHKTPQDGNRVVARGPGSAKKRLWSALSETKGKCSDESSDGDDMHGWGKDWRRKNRKSSQFGRGPLPALVSKQPENQGESVVVSTSDVGGDNPVSVEIDPHPTPVSEPDGEALASDDDDDDVDDQFTVASSDMAFSNVAQSPLPTWHSQTWRNQQACPFNEGDW